MSKPRAQKQAQISAFFGTPRPAAAAAARPTAKASAKAMASAKTPERPRAALSTRDAFAEIPSLELSLESPEVNNFRNPTLARSLSGAAAEPEVVDLTGEPRSSPTRPPRSLVTAAGALPHAPQPPLKRSHADLLSHLNGIPRKIPKRTPPPPVDFSASAVALSDEQQRVIKSIVQDGLNVFYTGLAGTGKLVVLRELVARLRLKYYESTVGVTASTGLAACNIGGQTIHRFLGIGLGEGTVDAMASAIKKKPQSYKRWKNLKVLIIDEVSMLHGALFAKLDQLGRALRQQPHTPFGGIQVVCTGDFFQLPPVVKQGQGQFCFEVAAWRQTIQKTILLTEVFRQKGDSELIDMLNSLRYGRLDAATAGGFARLARRVHYPDGIEPTELFPLREDVKRANDKRLAQLALAPRRFAAMDTSRDAFQVKMLDNLMCERELVLKEGAQVMYLKNLDDEIVNGSIGTVLFFLTPSLWEKAAVVYGEAVADDEQAHAELRVLSARIGAPQSADEDAAWERVPMDRRLRLQTLCAAALAERAADVYPVVRFLVAGRAARVVLVQREEFKIDLARVQPGGGGGGGGDNQLCRIQLPLILLWALSIHKAQGQTISRLRIDLKKVFERGQVYVALSRATSKDQLEIVNFDPRRIQVADKVTQFYRELEREAAKR